MTSSSVPALPPGVPQPSGRIAPQQPDDVRLAYDTVAADYAGYFPDTSAESPLDLAMVDAFVAAAACAAAGAAGTHPTVLDAGCGAGRLTRYLADRGCPAEGTDLSPGMIAMARRDHPDLRFGVAGLTDLPYAAGHFAGVLLWYSIIHTPPAGHQQIFAEAARVLVPGGSVLVGFQSGDGTKDVAPAYRRFGHDIRLERYLTTADNVAAELAAVGLREVCRLIRRRDATVADDQAFVLAVSE